MTPERGYDAGYDAGFRAGQLAGFEGQLPPILLLLLVVLLVLLLQLLLLLLRPLLRDPAPAPFPPASTPAIPAAPNPTAAAAAAAAAGSAEAPPSPSSMLLDLLERHADLFALEVLARLPPADRASLAGAGLVWRAAVYPESIFPAGLPPATTTTGGGAARVFNISYFSVSIERLAWAKANGCPWTEETCMDVALVAPLEVFTWAREHDCPWDKRTCELGRAGVRAPAPGGAEVGAGARVPLGRNDVRIRRYGWAPGYADVVAGERLPVGCDDDGIRRCGGTHGGAAVGAGPRVPGGVSQPRHPSLVPRGGGRLTHPSTAHTMPYLAHDYRDAMTGLHTHTHRPFDRSMVDWVGSMLPM